MTQCPRCHGVVGDGRLGRGAGPFRVAHDEIPRCTCCGAVVLERADVRRALPDTPLGGDATERDRRAGTRSCTTPSCFASLDEVTLGWGPRWAIIEQCPRCRLVVATREAIQALAELRR